MGVLPVVKSQLMLGSGYVWVHGTQQSINRSAAWIRIRPEQTTKRLVHELKAEEFNVVVFHQQHCFRILFDLGTQHAAPGFKELFIFFVTIH